MANITWIIGNGFDLQIGMKTRYTDFYKSYIKDTEDDNEIIAKFKSSILGCGEDEQKNWADFELAMGEASTMFDNPDDFFDCINDFILKFNTYLQNECNRIDWSKVEDDIYTEFFNTLTQFWEHIKTEDLNRFAKFVAL